MHVELGMIGLGYVPVFKNNHNNINDTLTTKQATCYAAINNIINKLVCRVMVLYKLVITMWVIII